VRIDRQGRNVGIDLDSGWNGGTITLTGPGIGLRSVASDQVSDNLSACEILARGMTMEDDARIDVTD
jgi:hypothetical protein